MINVQQLRMPLVLLLSVLVSGGVAHAEEKSADAAKGATIEITFTGIEHDRGGDLVASLYSGKETWLKPEKQKAIVKGAVKGKELKLKFEGVAPGGEYAVQVFHDANRNGELDFRRVIPIPTEGAGVSNNHERMGPPKYEKATFDVGTEDVELEIIIRYF